MYARPHWAPFTAGNGETIVQQLRFGDITVDRIVEAEGLGFPPEFLLPDSDIQAIRDYRD